MALFEYQNQGATKRTVFDDGHLRILVWTLTTLTVFHMAVFEYQNQGVFNRTVFDRGHLRILA
jgi:hypothetical protein